MGRVIRDFDHHAEYLPGRGGVATFDGPQTNVIFVGQTPVSQGMKLAGGTVTNLDPTKGFEIKTDDGKTVWLPANINSRLLPFIKGDKIDLNAAVKSGIDSIQDYGGLGITQEQIDAIKRGAIATDTISQANESNTVKVVTSTPTKTSPEIKEKATETPKAIEKRTITPKIEPKTETITEKVDNSAQIATINEAIKATTDVINDANSTIAEKEKELATLKTLMTDTTKQYSQRKDEGKDVTGIQKALDNAVASVNRLESEINEQKATIDTANKTIADYNKEVERLSNQTRTVTREVKSEAKTGGTYYGEAAGNWETADDSRFNLYNKPTGITVTDTGKADTGFVAPSDNSDVRVLDPRYYTLELPADVADLYGKDEAFTKLVDDTFAKVQAFNDDEERLAQLRIIMSNTNTFTEPRFVDRNDKEVVFVDKDGVIGPAGKEWTRSELSDEFYTKRAGETKAAKQDINNSLQEINDYKKTVQSNLKSTQDALKTEITALSGKIGELLKESKNMSTPEIRELQAQRDALNEQWTQIRDARGSLVGTKLTSNAGENANKLIEQAKDTITLRPYYSEQGLNVIDAIADGVDTKVLNRLGIKDETIGKALQFVDENVKIDGEWVNKEATKQLEELKANSYDIGGELYAKNDIDNLISQYPQDWQKYVRDVIFDQGIDAYNSFADLWQNEIAEDYAWAKSGYSKKYSKALDEKYTTPEGFIDLDKLYIEGKESILDKVQLTNSNGEDMTKAEKQALFDPYRKTENYIKDSESLSKDDKDAALAALKSGGIEGYNKWVDTYNNSIKETVKGQKTIKDIWGDFGFTTEWKSLPETFSDLATHVDALAETIELVLTPSDEEIAKRQYQGQGGGTGLLTHSKEESDIFKQAGINREPTGEVLFNVENMSEKLANYFDSKAEEIAKFEDTQFEKQIHKIHTFDENSLVDRTILKSLREMTVNNVHDLGIIANTIAANMVRMADGDPEALGKTAALGASLLGYVFTLPNKVVTDPENGIAESLGVLVPIPGIKDIASKLKGGNTKLDASDLPKLTETELAKENSRIDIATGQRSAAIDNAVDLMPKEQFTYNYDKFYDNFVDGIDTRVEQSLEEMSTQKELEKYNKQTNELDEKFNKVVKNSELLQDKLANAYANTLSVGIREGQFDGRISPLIYAFTDEKTPLKEINEKARQELAENMSKTVINEAKAIAEIAKTLPTTPAEKVTKAIMNEDANLKMQSELTREIKVLEELKDYALEQGMTKEATDMDIAIAEAKTFLDERMTFEGDKVITEDVATITRWIDEETAKTKLFNKWVQDKSDAINGMFDNKARKQTLKEINSEIARIERESQKKDLTLFAAQRLANEAAQIKKLILDIRTRDASNLGIPAGVLDKIYAAAAIDALNAALERPSSMFDIKTKDSKSRTDLKEVKEIDKAVTPEQIKEAEKQLQLNEGFNGEKGITPGTGEGFSTRGGGIKPLTTRDGDKAFDPKKTTTLTMTKEKTDLDLMLQELLEQAKEVAKKEQIQKALEKIKKDKETKAPSKKETDLEKKINDAQKEVDKLKDKTDPESLKKRRELQKKIKEWRAELDKLTLAKIRMTLKIEKSNVESTQQTKQAERAETSQKQRQDQLTTKRGEPIYKTREETGKETQTKTLVTPKLSTKNALDTTIKETEIVQEKYQFKPETQPKPELKITTKITTTTNTPTKEPPKEPGKPRLPRGGKTTSGMSMPKNSPYGQIAWRQGSLKIDGKNKPVWIVVSFENGQAKKHYVFQTPKGAQIIKRTPKETFYRTGKTKRATVNLGAMNVTIDPSSSKPLQFTRKIPNNKAINKMIRG